MMNNITKAVHCSRGGPPVKLGPAGKGYRFVLSVKCVTSSVPQRCGFADGFRPQGTKYWGLLRVWDDDTHEITIPVVKDASGCGGRL